jgi:hypothetical protein
VSNVLFLHFFEVLKKQDGIERIVALSLQLSDDPALTDMHFSPSATSRRALDNSLSAITKVMRKLPSESGTP